MTARKAKIRPLFTWRTAICESDLPSVVRHVALTMSLYQTERADSVRPGATVLARDTGLHLSTVKSALARLERDGWVILIERGGIRGQQKMANVYELAVPLSTDPVPGPVVSTDPSPTTTGRPQRPVAHNDRSPGPRSGPRRPVVQDDPSSKDQNQKPNQREIEKAAREALAREIASSYWDWYKGLHGGKPPPYNWNALRGIVRDALQAGFERKQVVKGLAALHNAGRPITRQTLWEAAENPDGRGQQRRGAPSRAANDWIEAVENAVPPPEEPPR